MAPFTLWHRLWGFPLVNIGIPITNWADQIHSAAIQYMNAEVCFYKVIPGSRDDITGEGDEGSVDILWRGKARVQHLRAPRDSSNNVQSNDSRAFRFQLDPDDNPPILYSGTKARVINGGRDPQLLAYAFSVDSAVNSSHMAVRTVELTANMRSAEWAWEVPSG